MDSLQNCVDRIQKPFASKEEFLKRDVLINRMVVDALVYSALGLAAGALLFRGKVPMGFCAGAAASWKIRDHI
jgi:hypothetical protein